jgi:glycosyltransferase involved in cell wall biosynthesis
MRKKIALYYPWCYLKSGVEKVILETVSRSRHEFTIFTNHIDYDQTFPEFGEMKNVVVLRDLPVNRSFTSVFKGLLTILTQKIDLQGYDALLVQSEGLGDFITFRNRSKPAFCFCHTPVRPVYDPVYRREYLAKHPERRFLLGVYSSCYRIFNRMVWRNYSRVFANSAEVKRRILAGRLCDPAQLEVLNPGVDVESIRPSHRQGKYFLYAGRVKWTKNVELAIRAFQIFREGRSDAAEWRLIIAGGVDRASGEYFARLREMAASDPAIVFTVDPTRSQLDELYDGCYALLYPPLNEDWGIVPIEAMAFGKPVIAVNSGGPKETILPGKTGFLLEPDPGAFAEKMRWLSDYPDQAAAMGAQCVLRARTFSWTAFVARLDEYIDTL